ncbi:hypothetical protein T06_8712 [Trichinella sp. T6]|nr:hypothetical protein T06_8712 [Trichinella sp. T6]
MVCFYCSKWQEQFPLHDIEAVAVATALIPETLQSDEGRNIKPEVLTEVDWLFGVAVTRTTFLRSSVEVDQ